MNDNFIIGLDIGTSFVRAAIGEIYSDGSVGIRGVATRPSSTFMRLGVITNPQGAVECIKDVIHDVQVEANCIVKNCVTALGGDQIKGRDETGSIGIPPLNDKTNRTVTEDDIIKVLEAAKQIPVSPDRKLISEIPKEFIIDKIRGFTHETALNTIAARLEVDVYLITASSTQYENLRQCIERSDLALRDVVLKTIACTDSCMLPEEQGAGSILIDMGGGTTDVLVVLKNAPICAFSIPIGGNRVTKDIVDMLSYDMGVSVSFETAEGLKIKYGSCWENAINDDMEIVIPGVGRSNPSVVITRSKFMSYIQPRMAEIFRKIYDHLDSTLENVDLAGSIVLTGGGANMSGVVELAAHIFNFCSVRVGRPSSLGWLEEKYRTPEFATAIGLVLSNGKVVSSVQEESKKTKKKSSSKQDGKGIAAKVWDMFFGF